MAIITRTRTLRPSTRKSTSNYKVVTEEVSSGDTLIVNIDHEDNPGEYLFTYEFDGAELANKNSIHFDAVESTQGWIINWQGDAIPKS